MTEPTVLPGETIWREQQPFISKKARDLSRSFNHVVQEEDLLQEAWLFCWEKEAHFLANNCRDVYVRRSIENVMVNYAKKMRDQVVFNTDFFMYAAEEVRDLLPTFLSSYEEWASFKQLPDGSQTMTKNDNVEIFSDFSRAWDRLNEGQQDILVRRYADGEESLDAKDRKALSRATNRFLGFLNQNKDIQNKDYDGPGAYLTDRSPGKERIQSTAAGMKAVSLDD